MIYYNYPPYYYGISANSNKKSPNTLNCSNNSTTYLNNNSQYSSNMPTTYNNRTYVNKQYKNSQGNLKKNLHNINITNQQAHEKIKTTTMQKEIPHKSNDDVIFEIFGIKLYFDDILLICLIFFLYNEGVQDQYLFIALVLLLLS